MTENFSYAVEKTATFSYTIIFNNISYPFIFDMEQSRISTYFARLLKLYSILYPTEDFIVQECLESTGQHEDDTDKNPPPYVAPKDQETFESTPWQKGNTGRTKDCDYNQYFSMQYRLVYTEKRLEKTEILVEKKKSPLKNTPETQCLCGGQNHSMGSPYRNFDPDPRSECDAVMDKHESDIFSELESVRAARKTTDRLNIAYDCEYVRKPGSAYRIITSYQFALYLPDNKTILEIVFLSQKQNIKNRLYLRTCIGAILDIYTQISGLSVITPEYKDSRCWVVMEKELYFDGSDETYTSKKTKFNSIDEAKVFQNALSPVVFSSSIVRKNDYKKFMKNGIPLELCIVCHCGIVDISAFKDDVFGFRKKQGNIMPYLNSIQGGLTSTYPYFVNVPTAKEYWKFYPVNILFRDTMCFAPANGKSLSTLGKCIKVNKIKLPKGAISHMGEYMEESLEDYMAYAAQDALVTLMYGSRIWGINKDWPLTATSGACFAMKQSIAKYLDIPCEKNGEVDTAEFNRIYRGYKTVDKGKIDTPSGLKSMKDLEPISYEAKQLHDFAAASYAGGFNTCSLPGVFQNIHTYDVDLQNAYPTAMCLVPDIDFENPIEREFRNESLSLSDFQSPVDPIFALVDFEFPHNIKYPCIAIHEGGSIIFPRRATAVYASGPSLYLALSMGATVHVRQGYKARTLLRKDGSPSMSLRMSCKQMVSDRKTAKKIYKEGSIEELLLKLFVNGGYGKIAQDVIEKNTWDGWNEHMVDIGYSAITSPERAALITDIVRCILIGSMNQLDEQYLISYSATTDGFITIATLNEINSVECYGFRSEFKEARLFLTDGEDPSIWEIKHEQMTLINPTTRCNIGFDIPEGQKGVLAHGGVSTYYSEHEYDSDAESIAKYIESINDDESYDAAEYKDGPEDKHKLAELILKRTKRVLYISREFPNIKDLSPSGKYKDFQTFFKSHQIRLDFDLKRKPIRETIHDVTGEIDGIAFTYANFETEPFDTIDEYLEYRSVYETFDCVRTKSDWDMFYQKLERKKQGLKTKVPDEWNKLFSVIQGYRMGLWSLPELDASIDENGNRDLKQTLEIINSHNGSCRAFNENAWKNSRRPERASQMLPKEYILDVLEEFNYQELLPDNRSYDDELELE